MSNRDFWRQPVSLSPQSVELTRAAILLGWAHDTKQHRDFNAMIVVLKPGITKKEEAAVLKEIRVLGYRPHVMRGIERVVVGAIGDERTHKSLETLASWPQVERVMPVQKRYKLVSREGQKSNSVVPVRQNLIGGKKFQVMAGPCSVEDERQLMTTAHAVQKAGATILRGGAFKPRTSPYEFQGLGVKGLKMLDKARRETGLAII